MKPPIDYVWYLWEVTPAYFSDCVCGLLTSLSECL
jgi:hypothetical protein